MKRLLLARHAETNYNEMGLCNGDPTVDVHLSGHGLAQAAQLAEQLRATPLDVIYVSEFPRTWQTAEVINTYHSVPMRIDARLNEHPVGPFEGQPVPRWEAAIARPETGETDSFDARAALADVVPGVIAFITDVKQRPETNVLVVTHGFITRVAVAALQSVPWESLQMLTQGSHNSFDL